MFLDTTSLNWVKRDDNNAWIVAYHFQLQRPAKCINRIGQDGLAIGSSDGYITMFSVRFDQAYIQLVKESEIREREPTEGVEAEQDVDW